MIERDCASVYRMLEAGTPFELIEAHVEQLPIPEEERSALWLLAWSERPLEERQSILYSTLAAANTPPTLPASRRRPRRRRRRG